MSVGFSVANSPLAIQTFAETFNSPFLNYALKKLEDYLSSNVKMTVEGYVKTKEERREAEGISKVLQLFKEVYKPDGIEITGGNLNSRGEGDNWLLTIYICRNNNGSKCDRQVTVHCTLIHIPYKERRISEIYMRFHPNS